MDTPDTNQRAEHASRRSLLRALGIGGAAVAVLGSARPAAAQDAGTTTTAPPKHPDSDDLQLLSAAKLLELTAAAGYAALTADRLAQLGFDDRTKELLTAIGAAHTAYAEALSALHGPGSPQAPSADVATLLNTAAFATGNQSTVLGAARAVEDKALDTHLALLEVLRSTNAAALVASIQIAEARHAAVLALLQGTTYDASAPVAEDGADALALADLTGDL